MSAEFFASGRACVRRALPVSSAMSFASSSTRASTASAIFCSRRPRSRGASLLQLAKALLAATTARSTSSALPRGTLAIRRRLAGFSTAISSPPLLPTQLPSISISTLRAFAPAAAALLIATAIAIFSSKSGLEASISEGLGAVKLPFATAMVPQRRCRLCTGLGLAGRDQIKIASQHGIEPAGPPAAVHVAHQRRGRAAVATHDAAGARTALEGLGEQPLLPFLRDVAERRHGNVDPRRGAAGAPLFIALEHV